MLLVALIHPRWAEAQPRDPAAAETLFQEARALAKDGHYAEACPKFAESHRLDPGTGVLLFLGDCYLQIGKTASAWAAYQEALPRAKSEGKAARVEAAERGIAAVTPRLVKLTVVVPPTSRVDGLEIRRDGVVMSEASWGTAVPVDPGKHRVEARAPGREPFSVEITIEDGGASPSVQVPTLPPSSSPPPPQPPRAIAPPPASRGTPPEEGMSSVRIAGFAVGAVGVAAVVVAAVTGGVVLAKRKVIDEHCNEDKRCDDDGLEAASSAKTIAIVNTVAWGAGIAGVGVGLVLVLAGGNANDRDALLVAPTVGPGVAALSMGGSF
jgi:hypothetical protein